MIICFLNYILLYNNSVINVGIKKYNNEKNYKKKYRSK